MHYRKYISKKKNPSKPIEFQNLLFRFRSSYFFPKSESEKFVETTIVSKRNLRKSSFFLEIAQSVSSL